MEASTAISFSSPKTHLILNLSNSTSHSSSSLKHSLFIKFHSKPLKNQIFVSTPPISLQFSPPLAVAEALEQVSETADSSRGRSRRVDKSGRFSSPRAARELALMIAYAACLEGSDPVRLFDRRVNAKRDPGYVFEKESLLRYDHMSFGGAPVEVETEVEADKLILKNEEDSANG